jgi:hypothetical protein
MKIIYVENVDNIIKTIEDMENIVYFTKENEELKRLTENVNFSSKGRIMRYKRITVATATTGGEKVEDCMEIEVLINEKVYKISEDNGELHIRVDGKINITPKANNAISINEKGFSCLN